MTREKLLFQTVGGLAVWVVAELILLSHPVAIAQSAQPSFDCSKATTRIETIICSDPELAEWDASLGRGYKQAYGRLVGNDRQGLIKDQRQWIASRNAECNQSELAETKACIIQFTRSRLAALAQRSSQPLPIESASTTASPNYLWEGWHKVHDPSHIQYKVFHDDVIALSNLSNGCGERLPLSISGKVAKANIDNQGLMIENFVLQTDDGRRSIINVERISILDPGMTTADLGWIVQGIETLLRPGRYIEGDAIPCGAGGGVLYLNKIASSSSAKPTTTSASTPSESNTHENVGPLAEGIPLSVEGGTFVIPVQINGQITLNFTIDSGAADVSIPADVVSTLIRTGTIQKGDFIGQKTYRLADGSTVPSATFVIRSLKVGNHLLENVTGSIASADADLLLGQSFLRRFNSWSIDNKRQVLLLN